MNDEMIWEEKAQKDYELVLGKVILTEQLSGYVGETDEQVTLTFDPPIAVRVLETNDLANWCGEYLDPDWEIEIVDQDHPGLVPEGLRSCWMQGTSYRMTDGKSERGRWRFQSWLDVIQRLCGNRPKL